MGDRPRMHLLQEVTVNRGALYQMFPGGRSAHIFISTDLAALGARNVFIVNVQAVRSRFGACFAWFDNERFVL